MPNQVNSLKDIIDMKLKDYLSVQEQIKLLESKSSILKGEIQDLCNEENIKTFTGSVAKVTFASRVSVKVDDQESAIKALEKNGLVTYLTKVPEHTEVNTKKLVDAIQYEIIAEKDLPYGISIVNTEYLLIKENKKESSDTF